MLLISGYVSDPCIRRAHETLRTSLQNEPRARNDGQRFHVQCCVRVVQEYRQTH